MSVRTHCTDTANVNVVGIHNHTQLDPLGLEPSWDQLVPAVVIEDPGNMEAWVVAGPFDELRALGQEIIDAADLAERWMRTDLCETCKDPDHQTCSLDPSCVCCRDTIGQME